MTLLPSHNEIFGTIGLLHLAAIAGVLLVRSTLSELFDLAELLKERWRRLRR